MARFIYCQHLKWINMFQYRYNSECHVNILSLRFFGNSPSARCGATTYIANSAGVCQTWASHPSMVRKSSLGGAWAAIGPIGAPREGSSRFMYCRERSVARTIAAAFVGQRHFRPPYKHDARASESVTSRPTRSRVVLVFTVEHAKVALSIYRAARRRQRGRPRLQSGLRSEATPCRNRGTEPDSGAGVSCE